MLPWNGGGCAKTRNTGQESGEKDCWATISSLFREYNLQYRQSQQEESTAEEALPRLKVCHLEQVSRLYKAETGMGCDGFHPEVPLDLTKETRREIVEFLEKVEQSG